MLIPLLIPGSALLSYLQDPASIAGQANTNDVQYQNSTGFSRAGSLALSWQLVSGDVSRTLLGYGPGAATGSAVDSTLRGSLWAAYAYRRDFAGIQVSASLLEYGALGLLIYAASTILCLRWAAGMWKREDVSPTWRGIAIGFPGVLLVSLAGTFYLRDWNTSVIACTFWFLAGALYSTAGEGRRGTPVPRGPTEFPVRMGPRDGS